MPKFLTVSPDRYGRFGHQTSSITAGILLAHLTNTKLIEPRYMYFCDKWNKHANFAKSAQVATSVPKNLKISYLEKRDADQNGNRKWNLNNKNELNELINEIVDSDDDNIVNLPFDQSAGLLLKLFNKKVIRDDIKKIFSFDKDERIIEEPYICIHIRRGDCTPTNHPTWYVKNEIFINIINVLAQIIPENYSIIICTQGDVAWINSATISTLISQNRFFISSTNQLFINDREIVDMRLMLNANILIGGVSSFSRWASILGNHAVLIDINRNNENPLKEAINLDPDNNIDFISNIISNSINLSNSKDDKANYKIS